MEELLKQILSKLEDLESKMDNLKQEQERIESKVGLLEVGQEVFMNALFGCEGKNNITDRTEALNKRVYGLEVDMQRLMRQTKTPSQ